VTASSVDLFASPFPALAPGEVHVWALDLDDAPAATLATLLDAGERRRAGAYIHAEHGRRFVAGRGLLRLLLGRYLDEAPEQLSFTCKAAGKPMLAGASRFGWLQFNVAHTGRLALYAVASGRDVGVDVEQILAERFSLRIADTFFSPREAALIRRLAEPRRAHTFFTLWTRREALLKATGDGLAGLDACDLNPDRPTRWQVQDLHVATGYAAALAVQGRSDLPLRLFARQPGTLSAAHADSAS